MHTASVVTTVTTITTNFKFHNLNPKDLEKLTVHDYSLGSLPPKLWALVKRSQYRLLTSPKLVPLMANLKAAAAKNGEGKESLPISLVRL